MIKFFRKIRYDLMEKNKTGKYLKYAIGEIVLVVIGILIALQINNANENRKTNIIRQNYYQLMLVDLNYEKEYVKSQIDRLNGSIASYETYIEYAKNPNLKPIEIVNALAKVHAFFAYFTFNTKSIETLESTGDIKLIPEIIRNKFIDIKLIQELLIRQQNGNDQLYITEIQKVYQLGLVRLLKHPVTFQDINVSNNITEIILTFEAALGLKNFSENGKIMRLNDMSEKVKELKELINEKITKG